MRLEIGGVPLFSRVAELEPWAHTVGLTCRIQYKKWPLTQWFLRSVKEEADEVRWEFYYFKLFIKNSASSKPQHPCIMYMGLSSSANQLKNIALR